MSQPEHIWNHILCFCLFLCACNLHPVNCDKYSNLSMSNIYRRALSNSPRNWHFYIKLLLHFKLKRDRNHLVGGNIPHLVKVTKVFVSKVALHSAELLPFSQRQIHETGRRIWRKPHSTTIVFSKVFTVQRLAGYLESNDSIWYKQVCSHLGEIPCSMSQVEQVWNFKLHSWLHLNLSFQLVDFFVGEFYSCSKGSTKILSTEKTVKQIVLCGFHSQLTIFPNTSSSKVVTVCGDFARCHVLLSYSIIDSKLITTEQVYPPQKRQFNVPILFCQMFQNMSFERQIFVVERKEVIVFSVFHIHYSDITVYDGPGILSRIIRPSAETYTTSSFICIVHAALHTGMFEFSRRTIDIATTTNVTKELMLMHPSNICQNHCTSCGILFSAPLRHHINITPLHFEFSGKDNILCYFAGLSAFSAKDRTFQVSGSECFNGVRESYRPMYSSTSEMLLVIYAHQEYGSLKTTLRITTTQCRRIQLNACSLAKCDDFGQYSFSYATCSQYNPDLRDHMVTGIKASLDLNRRVRSTEISVEKDECTVYQIHHDLSEYFYQQCRLVSFSHTPLQNKSASVTYDVSGFLMGEFFFSPAKFFTSISRNEEFTISFSSLKRHA